MGVIPQKWPMPVWVVPPINPYTITPHAEAFQGVIWHLIVSDPRMMQIENKWESVARDKS